ncbi:MAG: PPK2 family polyphosphate kinase [Planctomycetota bacterium]
MEHSIDCPELVSFDGTFEVAGAPTHPGERMRGRAAAKAKLEKVVARIASLQRKLYADNRYAVLVVFQAMDAAGKDSTIRNVLSGVNPAGFMVRNFQAPSHEELDHDFLWRTTRNLPERGRIGVFNRSYYEEVLIVRVRPELLAPQRLPGATGGKAFWQERLQSIRDHERHLAHNGTVIVKFFLNVSRDEQKRRFLDRIENPKKRWKFNPKDLDERAHWDAYMAAYEDAIRRTAAPWAPWYAIPADDKPTMRLTVAKILLATLQRLDVRFPSIDEAGLQDLARHEARLRAE